jgi:SAM-dependent methyltransferase
VTSETADPYAELAEHYHLIYADWRASIERQAAALDRLIAAELGPGRRAVLDASCGIGTQALGLAALGHRVHGTDPSAASVGRARREAAALGLSATFAVADMRTLASQVEGAFEVVLSADNALAHLLTEEDLARALGGLRSKLRDDGLLIVTLRDYDAQLGAGGGRRAGRSPGRAARLRLGAGRPELPDEHLRPARGRRRLVDAALVGPLARLAAGRGRVRAGRGRAGGRGLADARAERLLPAAGSGAGGSFAALGGGSFGRQGSLRVTSARAMSS